MGSDQSRLNQQHELYKVGVTTENVSKNGIFINVPGFATCLVLRGFRNMMTGVELLHFILGPVTRNEETRSYE